MYRGCALAAAAEGPSPTCVPLLHVTPPPISPPSCQNVRRDDLPSRSNCYGDTLLSVWVWAQVTKHEQLSSLQVWDSLLPSDGVKRFLLLLKSSVTFRILSPFLHKSNSAHTHQCLCALTGWFSDWWHWNLFCSVKSFVVQTMQMSSKLQVLPSPDGPTKTCRKDRHHTHTHNIFCFE